MRELQNALLAISGQKTVPNIFIREQHIGGCDDTLKVELLINFEELKI